MIKEKMEKLVIGKKNLLVWTLIALELVVIVFFVSSMSLYTAPYVNAVVGSPNATVQTILTVGNVYPEILSVIIVNNSAGYSLTLNPNSTIDVTVYVVARDYNNESDIQNITLRFFDNANSNYAAADDNNNHYSNDTCVINTAFGDGYTVNATCTVSVWYYANNQTWNATVRATDNSSYVGEGSNTTTINTLLAFAMPSLINYSTVNATQVSNQQIENVTNAGNQMVNLSLSGYGATVGDGWALNCTLGAVQNISIIYEKYNLTGSNDSTLSLSQFESVYTNLTSNVVTKTLNLNYRQNDTGQGFDDTNSTYWRVYVPIGVAGTCSGNIVFGATQGAGS